MKSSLKQKRLTYLEGTVSVLFALFVAALIGFIIVYWTKILEPRLRDTASAGAMMLAQFQSNVLAERLTTINPETNPEFVIEAIDKMLLPTDPDTKKPFIEGVVLELDEDVVKAPWGYYNFILGSTVCDNCFITDIPLYNQKSKELLGVARFYISGRFFVHFKQDVRTRLYSGFIFALILPVLVWVSVKRLIKRIRLYAMELERAKDYADNIIASMHDALLVTDMNGKILTVNSYAEEVLGYDTNELKDIDINLIMATSMKESSDKSLNDLLSVYDTVSNREMDLYKKDTNRLPVIISASKLKDHDGTPTGIIFIAKDISSIKEAEQELKQKQAQLVHAGRLSALGEMATAIAHEINQPLTIIQLASDAILKSLGSGAKHTVEYASVVRIIDQIKRTSAIIDNMRNFARASTVISESVNVDEVVKTALSFFKEQFRLHGITLSVYLDAAHPPVTVNPQSLEQIVVNLMSNARYAVEKLSSIVGSDYTKEVTVKTSFDEGTHSIVLEVTDNGIGMPRDVIRRCLEPFFTTKGMGEGTGLGLSIVHSIIKEFRMGLEIISKEGLGSTFRVIIPCTRGDLNKCISFS